MANMYDYISWRGDLPFEQSPFNPVDNIIFSQLAYLPLDGIVPGPGEQGGVSIAEAAGFFAEKQIDSPSFPGEDPMVKEAAGLIDVMGTAPRYRNCRLCGYVSQIDPSLEKQFSALSVMLSGKWGKGTLLVLYRGTDMSLVGWKESFNMSFNGSVPSQQEAVSYLEKMAERSGGPLLIAGHSKGGNLAIYAAAHCSPKTSSRISTIYSNDAPGFSKRTIKSKGYREISSRIQAFIPQSSLVGILFEHGVPPVIVKSTKTGPMQHILSSWEVTYNDMNRVEELSKGSLLVENILNDWISGIEKTQRRQFIGAIYTILTATNARSISDLTVSWFKSAGSIISSLKNIDDPTRKLIGKTIGDLFRAAGNSIKVQRERPSNKPKKITDRKSHGETAPQPGKH